MNRMSVFNSPFLLGFEQFERTIDRISKLSTDSYPPYNIEQISSSLLRITVAVAGFDKKDLEINLEGNQLQIKGFKNEDNEDKIYLPTFLHKKTRIIPGSLVFNKIINV